MSAIRHKCPIEEGCYIHEHWPKVELLERHLPGNREFTDIDLGFWRGHATHFGSRQPFCIGCFLFLEWKSWPEPGPLLNGQDWFLRDLSALGDGRIFVLCAAGDPRTMDVHHIAYYRRGQHYPWRPTTTDQFNNTISRWGKWAEERVRADELEFA
jgi:hypothetical protein